MTLGNLRAVPAFLRLLGSLPEPDDVAAALMHGPFGTFDVRCCWITRLDHGDLVTVATAGATREERERYAILPGRLNSLTARVVHDGAISVTEDDPLQGSAFLKVDNGHRRRMYDRLDVTTLARAAIVLDGTPLGSVSIHSASAWSEQAQTVLEVCRRALALWMGHPASGLAEIVAHARANSHLADLVLTDRQNEVLELIAAGESNAAIAHRLQVSLSTVKADVAELMRVLGTGTRSDAVSAAREAGLL